MDKMNICILKGVLLDWLVGYSPCSFAVVALLYRSRICLLFCPWVWMSQQFPSETGALEDSWRVHGFPFGIPKKIIGCKISWEMSHQQGESSCQLEWWQMGKKQSFLFLCLVIWANIRSFHPDLGWVSCFK